MPWFFRRKQAPLPRPAVERFLLARADEAAVLARLRGHDELGFGQPAPIIVRSAGGWTRVDLPDSLHPWSFHDIALWLFDLPGARRGDVLAVSEAFSAAPGYALADDEVDDWLSGVQEDGTPITVAHPSAFVVRGEGASDTPASVKAWLSALSVPTSLLERGPGAEHTLRFEDPGDDLNPRLETTDDSRHAMRRRDSPHLL